MMCWSPLIFLATAAFTLLLQPTATDAKHEYGIGIMKKQPFQKKVRGGCASFGHSCYGGMGKRASDLLETNDEILQDVQVDQNPAFVFTGPRSEYKPDNNQRLTPQQQVDLYRIVRQWIQSYRKAQEMGGNAI